jgi:hypothetical protein
VDKQRKMLKMGNLNPEGFFKSGKLDGIEITDLECACI